IDRRDRKKIIKSFAKGNVSKFHYKLLIKKYLKGTEDVLVWNFKQYFFYKLLIQNFNMHGWSMIKERNDTIIFNFK
ncbi:MAG: hypothetical protein ACTHKC_08480, partial [Candidatus Nitrosocosmicus sp.]